MMAANQFSAQDFWDQRIKSDPSLRGTGHRAFDFNYNYWLYQAQKDSLDILLEKHSVDVSDQDVLDVGSGTGFYVEYYQQKGAASVTGIDIAQSSIRYLRETYPSATFFIGDISSRSLPVTGKFALVSAVSVLYHVVSDGGFQRALGNMCKLLNDNGYLVISDLFSKPLMPTAKHAKFRPLDDYQVILKRHGIDTIDTVPIYYLLNRIFVPILGPKVIGFANLAPFFYRKPLFKYKLSCIRDKHFFLWEFFKTKDVLLKVFRNKSNIR
jgi:SAM-dependent methyltransferase